MFEHLDPHQKTVIEGVYQKIILDFGRLGRKNGLVMLAYSHRSDGFKTIRKNDYRYEQAEGDPNYEIIATYSGIPLPRIDQVAGDVMAYFDEQAKRAVGYQSPL